jgi:hypothetical protein
VTEATPGPGGRREENGDKQRQGDHN